MTSSIRAPPIQFGARTQAHDEEFRTLYPAGRRPTKRRERRPGANSASHVSGVRCMRLFGGAELTCNVGHDWDANVPGFVAPPRRRFGLCEPMNAQKRRTEGEQPESHAHPMPERPPG